MTGGSLVRRKEDLQFPVSTDEENLVSGTKAARVYSGERRSSTTSRIGATIRKPRFTAVGQPEWIRNRSRKCVKFRDQESVSFPSRSREHERDGALTMAASDELRGRCDQAVPVAATIDEAAIPRNQSSKRAQRACQTE